MGKLNKSPVSYRSPNKPGISKAGPTPGLFHEMGHEN